MIRAAEFFEVSTRTRIIVSLVILAAFVFGYSSGARDARRVERERLFSAIRKAEQKTERAEHAAGIYELRLAYLESVIDDARFSAMEREKFRAAGRASALIERLK